MGLVGELNRARGPCRQGQLPALVWYKDKKQLDMQYVELNEKFIFQSLVLQKKINLIY